MKRILTSVLAGFIALSLFSQSERDSLVYQTGLKLLGKSSSQEELLKTASYFESLAKEYPGHWLACYYTAFSYIMAAKSITTAKVVDETLDKAQQYIDKSVALKPAEPENYIIQAFLYQVRLSVDPGRALSLSQKAESSLNKAIAADSGNPRAYFLMASNIYYTPPLFKGGPKNALPVFLKAKDKYRTYKPALSYAPSWGEQQNEEMIRLCNSSKG
jgi:hypothetical protein